MTERLSPCVCQTFFEDGKVMFRPCEAHKAEWASGKQGEQA